MRVIITGGTGLVGGTLAQTLVAEGHEVVALTRQDPAKRLRTRTTPPDTNVQFVQWDARTATGWAHLADGADVIVNLAGENISGGRWTKARRRRILESRVNAGAAVLDAIRQATTKPRVLIQASGADFYPPSGDRILDESAPPGTSWLSRVAWEWETSTAAAARMGVRRIVARSGVILDRHSDAFPRMKLPFDLLIAGGPLGSGRQYVPWIHLKDEVRAIRFLIENEQAEGPFNLASPNPVTYKEFARTMGEVMRRPSFMRTPGFALKLALGEMSSIVLASRRQVPTRLLEMGFSFLFPDLELALRDLLGKPKEQAQPATG